MNFGIFTMVPTTNAGTSSPKFLQIFKCKKKRKIFSMWRIAFMLALDTFPNKRDGQKLMNFPGLRTFQALFLLLIWTELNWNYLDIVFFELELERDPFLGLTLNRREVFIFIMFA
jgi:uncharacterized protein (DUF486 family)